MTTTPEALLTHAGRQAAEADEADEADEASMRSAISRAYYASFHRCLLLEGNPLTRQKFKQPVGGVHQQLIKRLSARSRIGTAKQRRQGKALERLMRRQRERRVTADYLLDKKVEMSAVTDQINDARQVFDACAW